MAADCRSTAGHLHFMASGRTTVERALVSPKRLAVGAAIRCPGRFAAVPGRVLWPVVEGTPRWRSTQLSRALRCGRPEAGQSGQRIRVKNRRLSSARASAPDRRICWSNDGS
jgi:hypothetical protein